MTDFYSVPGPYAYDPNSGFGITGTATNTTAGLDKGRSYPSVDVVDASDFTQTGGYVVFNFGYENQVGPVRYNRTVGTTGILIDSSFKMTSAVPAGSTVILLYSRAPYVSTDPTTGSFYATASSAGSVTAQKLIREISATGIELDVTVRYPGDRGLGGEGQPTSNNYRLSDVVSVFGGDELDEELSLIKEGE